MRIGIFGGSFDPIHFGHIRTAQAVFDKYCLDRFFFVPTGVSPGKSSKQPQCSLSDRWTLLSAAIRDFPDFYIYAAEINSPCVSYTADTIRNISLLFPEAELYLIVGSDLLPSFFQWFRIDYILQKVHLIIVERDGEAVDAYFSNPALKAADRMRSSSACSSTDIRKCLAAGLPISDAVPPKVENFIYARGLYLPDLYAKISTDIKRRQTPKRYLHSIGVVKTAVGLCNRLHIDSENILIAAILHDIAKELPFEKLYGLTGEEKTGFSRTTIKAVLHAPAGAVLAQKLYPVSQETYRAILLHCTLDDIMTVQDKILYLADIIEPSRRIFPTLLRLRELCEEMHSEAELDKIIILAIEQNICYIRDNGGEVHPASLRALRTLKNKSERCTWKH